MFIPSHIRRVLVETVHRSLENTSDMPLDDRPHSLAEHQQTIGWLNSLYELVDYDTGNPIKVPCTDVKRGDLFRPLQPGADENTNDWRVFLAGEMAPGDSWEFAMAYGDVNSGLFDGIHHEHDSNYVQVLTSCTACGEQQATEYDEITRNGETITGTFCPACHETWCDG